MTISKRIAAMILTAAAIALPSLADVPKDAVKDWPQWHGPSRDNISKETGLLKEWPKEGPPLAWKATGLGGGYSSISIADGKIFTAGEEGPASFVVAISESDGKPLWKSPLGKSGGGGGYAGPRATPTIDGTMLYVIGQFGDIVCLTVADGKEVWRKNLNSDFAGKMMSGWGNSESLLIDGDNLICTPGGKAGTVLALNKKTGEKVWRSTGLTEFATYASPVVAEIGGVRQIIVMTHVDEHGDKNLRNVAGVAAVAAKDGALLWQIERPGNTAVIPTPVVKDNYIYVTCDYGVGCDLYKINADAGKFSAEAVYPPAKRNNMENKTGGVVLFNGYIYGHSDSGGWVCQDFMTGDIKWKAGVPGARGTITYADGNFYLRDEGKKGTLVLIEASSDGWKEHGRFDQPERSGKDAWAHLVIANGKLYVRDQSLLFCYDVKAK